MLLDSLNLIAAALRIDRSAEASDAGANDDNPPMCLGHAHYSTLSTLDKFNGARR
jgi:hypothetical protein